MEEIEPVLSEGKFGKIYLKPQALAEFDEEEILKVARHIGTALAHVHHIDLIHRDVKLENIFYLPGEDVYKLGDFGIARITDGGWASTRTFTNGYGAPEVILALEDVYDKTADIYSFGMMLYVLLNRLRFPQSMDDVLNAFESLEYGDRLPYQRSHKSTVLLMGWSLAVIGSVLCAVSFKPLSVMHFSKIQSLYFGLLIWSCVADMRKKNREGIILAAVAAGIYLAHSSDCVWWQYLLLVAGAFMPGCESGAVGAGALLMHLVCRMMEINHMSAISQYRWIAVLTLSLSGAYLNYYTVLENRSRRSTKLYLGKIRYWYLATLAFCVFLRLEHILTEILPYIEQFFGFTVDRGLIYALLSMNPEFIGIGGVGVGIFWIVRERILMKSEERAAS